MMGQVLSVLIPSASFKSLQSSEGKVFYKKKEKNRKHMLQDCTVFLPLIQNQNYWFASITDHFAKLKK